MWCVCVRAHTDLDPCRAEEAQRAGDCHDVAVIHLQHPGKKSLGGLKEDKRGWLWGQKDEGKGRKMGGLLDGVILLAYFFFAKVL